MLGFDLIINKSNSNYQKLFSIGLDYSPTLSLLPFQKRGIFLPFPYLISTQQEKLKEISTCDCLVYIAIKRELCFQSQDLFHFGVESIHSCCLPPKIHMPYQPSTL